MINLYHYFYFRVFKFNSSLGITKYPDVSAILIQSLVLMFNMMTISDIIEIHYFKTFHIEKWIWQVLTLLICFVNFFYYQTSRRHKRIVQSYSKKKYDTDVLGGVMIIAYIMLSVWAIFNFGDQLRALNVPHKFKPPVIP